MKRDARRIAQLEARIGNAGKTVRPERRFDRVEIIYVRPPDRDRLDERRETPDDGNPWLR